MATQSSVHAWEMPWTEEPGGLQSMESQKSDMTECMLTLCNDTCLCAKSLQLCPTLCNLMDCSPPGSYVHGILQARILEWVAISFSRESSRPRDRTQVSRIAGIRFNL